MNNIPAEKAQIQAQAGNPIVAKAKKVVPGKWQQRWDKTKKWVKAHRQTIFLTLETLGSLAIAYVYYKKGLEKLQRDYYQATGEVLKAQTASAQELGNLLKAQHGAAKEALLMQNEALSNQKILMLKVKALEEAVKDPRFADYLAKKHGITSLEPVKK